ncbi:MAG: hypothetical protein V1660_02730 [archaeon]
MNKEITILGFIFLIGIILCSNTVSAFPQCCVINNSQCTFWDMGDSSEWTDAGTFCTKLEQADSYFHTLYYSDSCSAASSSLPDCKDGYGLVHIITCGDSTCEAPESCSSCSQDCGACPIVSSSGGGGGGCTPNWNCTDWNNCGEAGKQTRVCVNLKPSCNKNKPSESKNCTYVAPKVVEPVVSNITQEVEEAVDAAPINEENNQKDINSNPGITGNVVKTTGGVGTNVAIVASIGVIMAAVIFFVLRFAAK